MSTAALTGVAESPAIQDSVKTQISSELVGGVPFISDAQLQTALAAAGVPQADADAIAEINATARLEALQVAFALVALVAIGALFITARIPTVPPGAVATGGPDPKAGGGAGSGLSLGRASAAAGGRPAAPTVARSGRSPR